MNQYKMFKFMERFWLVFAIFSLLFATWFISKGDWDQGKFPLFTAFCGGILFGLRRYQRKKAEGNPRNKPPGEK
ncbi:MAG: hypothetical protein WED33_07930 [Bacteroidia bacterium]